MSQAKTAIGLWQQTSQAGKLPRAVNVQLLHQIYLQDAGGFNYVSRETTHPKLPEGMKTYWLIGLTGGGETTVLTATTETKSNA